jgi:hypothetical protein
LTSFAIWIAGFVPVYAFDESVNRQRQIKKLKAIYGNPGAEAGS